MCLAIPGKIVEIEDGSSPLMGSVDFGGIQKRACLDWTPGVKKGDYVIVHVGFAISKVEEEEAKKVFEYLQSIDELNDIQQSENNQ